MKKLLFPILAVALLLSGCGSWMDGSYVSIKPHVEATTPTEDAQITVSDYAELRNAVEFLVTAGKDSGIVYMDSDYPQDYVQRDLHYVTEYICNRTAVGAYAVAEIRCEVGSVAGMDAVAVTIDYRHNRSEMQAITRVRNMEEVSNAILTALDKCEAGSVIMVTEFGDMDFNQVVQDYAILYPEIVMETPIVSAVTYPNSGETRILELSYTYQTSRETLRAMRTSVEPVFSSAALYVSDDSSDHEKFSQLYSFLTERYQYRFETSITPSYSLLRHGVGDSKAFAIIYASMCRKVGLECDIVSGTRQGESLFWNILCDDGKYYHVDLLRCIEEDAFMERYDSEMEGYVWDYSAYPACMPEEPVTEEIAG